MGLPDCLTRWMTSFLCERQQRVKLGNISSGWRTVGAGVPQGTLTGPIAFLLHINSLRTVCPLVKYVDGSTIWEVCNRDGSDSVLQTAADQASQWTDENNMILNTDKTKIMEIYFGEKPLNTQPVTVNGTPIECVNVFKLLGIMINSNLSFTSALKHQQGYIS